MNTERRSVGVSLLLIFLLMLVSTAVFSEGDREGAKPEQSKSLAGTHIVALLYSSPEGNALRQMIESGKFQALSGISVEVTMLSWENTRQKLFMAFTAKQASYDAVLIDNPWVMEMALRKVIAPLKQFVNDPKVGSPDFNVNDFPPQLLSRVSLDNDYYALPYTLFPSMMMYRKDLFADPKEKAAFKAKYGYELESPKTYTQFKDVAEFFTRPATGDQAELYGTTAALKQGGFAFNRWKQYAYAFGGHFFDEKGQPTIDTPQNVKGLEFLIGLKPFMPPAVIEMSGGDSGAYFSSGKAAMLIDFSAYAPIVTNPQSSKVADKVGFAVAPKGEVHAVGNGGTVLSVYSLSQHKEAAYKLIEWVCSVEGERLNLESNISPMRVSLARDPAVKQKLPWVAYELETNLNVNYADPLDRRFPLIQDITGEEINAAFCGVKSAKQALADAQARVERELQKVSR